MNDLIAQRIAEIVEENIEGIKPFTFAALDDGQIGLLNNGYKITFGPGSSARRTTGRPPSGGLFVGREITITFSWENKIRDAKAKSEREEQANAVNRYSQVIRAIDSDEKIFEMAKNFNFVGDSGIIEGKQLFLLETTFNLEL